MYSVKKNNSVCFYRYKKNNKRKYFQLFIKIKGFSLVKIYLESKTVNSRAGNDIAKYITFKDHVFGNHKELLHRNVRKITNMQVYKS